MLNARTLFPPLFRPVASGGGSGGDVEEKIAEIDSQITRIDSQITRIDSQITSVTDDITRIDSVITRLTNMTDVETPVYKIGDEIVYRRRIYLTSINTNSSINCQIDGIKNLIAYRGSLHSIDNKKQYSLPLSPLVTNDRFYLQCDYDNTLSKEVLYLRSSTSWSDTDGSYIADVVVDYTKNN